MNWTKFNNFKKEIAGRKVLILGLGLQGGGVGAAKFFHEMDAKIRVSDLKSEKKLASSLAKLEHLQIEKYVLGEHRIEDIDWADIILLNPDIPHDADVVQYAMFKKKELQMEEALFTKLSPVDIVGVTGTRGKTTTTMIAYELIKTQYPTFIDGNVAGSETLMTLLEMQDENTQVVLELSSFQLFGFHIDKISPHIAVLTNIYEDHLNRYKNMEEYIHDKEAIYLYQQPRDYLIYNKKLYHDELVSIPNNYLSKKIIFDSKNVNSYDLKLKGEHNRENYSASLKVAQILNIDDANIRRVFANFSGVPFRQEEIGEVNGITFINDTTATTPKAAEIAIDRYKNKGLILIAGGNSKKCNFDIFAQKASQYAKKIILLKGNATEDFKSKLIANLAGKTEKVSKVYDNFESAVENAYQSATRGDNIVLSPGFTSFGMFENEFDRGRQFNEAVKKICSKN